MSKPHVLVLCLSPAMALALAMALAAGPASSPSTDSSNAVAARLETYAPTDGAACFALSLSPAIEVPAAGKCDVVVLFDTSASQTSTYRDKALASLDAFLSGLHETDRVKLMAVDLQAVPLTSTFVSAQGDEITKAIAALHKRIPLGSTDMAAALEAASGSFSAKTEGAKSNAVHSIVYIGDGMSTANFLDFEGFPAVVKELTQKQISVTSYAIGPRLDAGLLAALANQTGGMLAVDGDLVDAKQAGSFLVDGVRSVVLWPTDVAWPKAFAEVYPQHCPPLRGDRDTVVIGRGEIKGDVSIAVTAQLSGKATKLNWTVRAASSNEDYAFLPTLIDSVKSDKGLSLPTVGTPGLLEAGRLVTSGIDGLTTLGSQAAAAGNFEGAKQLAAEALRRDPKDPTALQLNKGVMAKLGSRPTSRPANVKIEKFRSEQAAPPAAADAADEGDETGLLGTVESQNKVITSLVRAEVENAIKVARTRMSQDPAEVVSTLKQQLEQIDRVAELDAETRAQLRGKLRDAVQEAQRREIEKTAHDLQTQQADAARKETRRINEALERDQEKVRQLMDRFDSLMDEGRYALAEDIAAAEVQNIAPDSPIAVSAAVNSRTTGFTVDALVTRIARQKGFVNTLYQCELSHVPFPDDQPIIYPDASTWLDLTHRREKYKSADFLKKPSLAEDRIRKELDEPTNVEFTETPLADVIEYLKDLHKIEIQLDTKALEEASIGSDVPVTRNLKGIKLKSALKLILGSLDLTYTIENEVLLITTPDKAGAKLITKVYPVADLVLPIRQTGFSGGFGGLGGGQSGGGFGQGGGGQGGGIGGGGQFGAGGGGGGGGLGGGGGGGFFNVPDPRRQPQPGGFQAFAVQDDLKLSGKNKPAATAPATATTQKPAMAAKPNAAKPNAAKPNAAQQKGTAAAKGAAPGAAKATTNVQRGKPLSLTIPKGTDPQTAWTEYFSKHDDVKTADVRETVRQLGKQKKFKDMIALIQGALAAGNPQPWMYEALDLAMIAEKRPAEERERVLMSAVDFEETAEDLLNIAQYMGRTGLERRATQLVRQVAKLDPMRPEPYALGLALAERTGDLEAKKWASLGVLSQAWPKDKQQIWVDAGHSATAVMAQLNKDGRTDEADDFQQQINRALERDCVVKVTWTGDADVDLFIEEPGGTICSFREPRTTSGGVMLGDTASRGPVTSDGLSETYVCPQGFSGTYKVLLRRVWGKVTAGKVTVDVYAHYGTEEVQRIHEQVKLGDEDSIVAFELADGRRQEPLAQQQVANAAAGQMSMNSALLAQQLNSSLNPSTGLSLANSRQGLFGGPFRQGGVGFQPVIITLPSGTNFTATGVVSADRRYVRITALPLFSAVGDVTTFNFTGGGGSTTTPGGGGVGGGGVGGIGGGGGGGGGIGGNPQPVP